MSAASLLPMSVPPVAVLVSVALVGVASGVLVSHVLENARDGAAAVSEAYPPAAEVDVGESSDQRLPPSTWVARRGDSLWTIAGRLAPGMDRRRAVDLLVRANGGAVLREGEVVDVSPLESDG